MDANNRTLLRPQKSRGKPNGAKIMHRRAFISLPPENAACRLQVAGCRLQVAGCRLPNSSDHHQLHPSHLLVPLLDDWLLCKIHVSREPNLLLFSSANVTWELCQSLCVSLTSSPAILVMASPPMLLPTLSPSGQHPNYEAS